MELQGKIVIVIGASGGIGREISRSLRERGATIVAVGRNSKLLKTIGDRYYICDLSHPEEVGDLVKNLSKDLPKIDVLINAAGVAKYMNLEEITADDIDVAFEVNVKAPFLLMNKLLPLLQKSSDSLVINIGSGTGTIPMKGRSIYCGTKFALRGITLTLAEEFKNKRPEFILITLGSTLTKFGPMSLEEKKEEARMGKAYFPVDWVASKLTEIIESNDRQEEYVLFPSGYGFGEWKNK